MEGPTAPGRVMDPERCFAAHLTSHVRWRWETAMPKVEWNSATESGNVNSMIRMLLQRK